MNFKQIGLKFLWANLEILCFPEIFDPDRPVPTNPVKFSGTVFAEFQFVTEDFVKSVVQEMSQKSCDLDPIPTPVLCDCWISYSHCDQYHK